MKTFQLPLRAGLLACALCGQAAALTTGDIAFVLFNSTNQDDLAFVALTLIPGNEVIQFTDANWAPGDTGGSFPNITTDEGRLAWTAPAAGVPAGTVVTLRSLASTSPTTSHGNIGRFGSFLIGSSDMVYAYQGSNPTQPEVFLAAAANTSLGSLTHTGLTAGTTAVLLADGANGAEYTGPRDTRTTFAAYLGDLGDLANWSYFNSINMTLFDNTAFTVVSDTTPPAITGLDPPDNAADVPVAANFRLSFSENIFPGQGAVTIRKGSDHSLVDSIPVAATTVDGTSATINPAVVLSPTTSYYLQIPAGAYRDAAGNPCAALTDPAAWNFTTAEADSAPPYIVFLSPASGAKGIAPGTNLLVEFDEPVQAGNGQIQLRRSTDNSVAETIAVGSSAVTIQGSVMTVSLSLNLAPATSYHVLLDPGCVEDFSANPFPGIANPLTWAFQTTALRAGSIALTGFNADGTDDLAFVAIDPIEAGETIIFTDNEWNGLAAGSGGAFNLGEGQLAWTAPVGGIAAGTVVNLRQIRTPGILASTGSAIGSLDLDTVGESVYAFAGSSSYPVFLTFASNHAADSIAGTGLTLGSTAVLLPDNADIAAYAGPRNSESSVADYLPKLADTALWLSQDRLFLDDSADGTAPDVPFDTTPFSLNTVNHDGDGTASLANADPGSPFANSTLFGRKLQTQSVRLTVRASSAQATLGTVQVVVPADFGPPVLPALTLSGAGLGGGTPDVNGQLLTITGTAVTAANPLVVTLSSLQSPDPATPADNGNRTFLVRTAGNGGTPADIAAPPVARVIVPLANLRDNDANGVPADLGATVAVEGVCSEGNFALAGTSAFLQDADAGLNVFSSAFNAGLLRGTRYAVLGTIDHNEGLTRILPASPADIFPLGAASQPAAVALSLVQLLDNAESFEGRLVTIQNVTKVAGTWSAGGSVTVQDPATDQLNLFLAEGSTANREPSYPATITGILTQADADGIPLDTGYLLQPRDNKDTGVILTDYESWVDDVFGPFAGNPATAPDKDFDGDRLSNREEYLFGLNPASAASASPLKGGLAKAGGSFTYTRRNPALTGATYSPQTSSTLAGDSWATDSGATETIVAADGDNQTVRVTLSPNLLTGQKLFVRVRAD